ncbi:MAG TPA: LysR family transcriptional regulator [Rhizomicrobium sp.]|jgi:molybdate transport system regulatory protein|nr:LysR family transcriptional regulator [Rhizomicrobium sp.]
MARLTIRIDLGESAAFGPGKARLLELVDETKSIRQAAAAMDMSYRRAWLLLRETEAMMKTPVTTARTGGKEGGGTVLTPTGRAVVECYRAIEAQAERSTLAQINKFAGMTKSAHVAATLRKRVTRHKAR